MTDPTDRRIAERRKTTFESHFYCGCYSCRLANGAVPFNNRTECRNRRRPDSDRRKGERRTFNRRTRDGNVNDRYGVPELNPAARVGAPDRRRAPEEPCAPNKWLSCVCSRGTLGCAIKHAPAAAPTPVQPAGAPELAHRFALRVQAYISACRGTDRMTGALADLNRDAEGVLKSLAAASVPVQPVTPADAREWLYEREVAKGDRSAKFINKSDWPSGVNESDELHELLAAFANRTAPAREGK